MHGIFMHNDLWQFCRKGTTFPRVLLFFTHLTFKPSKTISSCQLRVMRRIGYRYSETEFHRYFDCVDLIWYGRNNNYILVKNLRSTYLRHSYSIGVLFCVPTGHIKYDLI